jgi:hypothetical protein
MENVSINKSVCSKVGKYTPPAWHKGTIILFSVFLILIIVIVQKSLMREMIPPNRGDIAFQFYLYRTQGAKGSQPAMKIRRNKDVNRMCKIKDVNVHMNVMYIMRVCYYRVL